MLMDNDSLGVKFSRTLGNGDALLVTAKKEEADHRSRGRDNRGLEGSDKPLLHRLFKAGMLCLYSTLHFCIKDMRMAEQALTVVYCQAI